MGKLVRLKFQGTLTQSFTVSLSIGEEHLLPNVEKTGHLPACVELREQYQTWRLTYRQMGQRSRGITPIRVQYNGGIGSVKERCQNQWQQLTKTLNQWLQHDGFKVIFQQLMAHLSPEEIIRISLQSSDSLLYGLPWQDWSFVSEYRNAEIVFSPMESSGRATTKALTAPVKLLAVLGSDKNLDLTQDQDIIRGLPQSKPVFLHQERRRQFSDTLASEPWQILFFAGHSETVTSETVTSETVTSETIANDPVTDKNITFGEGRFYLNDEESLSFIQLRNILSEAIAQGLQIAIFNSCDGLGLARDLAALDMPHMIVMREQVPDEMAHGFLRYFLTEFAKGTPLHLSLRRARERLESFDETVYPCATALPCLWQAPTAPNLTWPRLAKASPHWRQRQRLLTGALVSVSTALLTFGLRYGGWLQPLELRAYDQLLQSRPAEPIDPRMLVVHITEDDIDFENAQRLESISDNDLEVLLDTLDQANPRVIGLDLYREFPVGPERQRLAELLGSDRLISICKPDIPTDPQAIPPSPNANLIAISTTAPDFDNVHRRHLLAIGTPIGACAESFTLSSSLAFAYLEKDNIDFHIHPQTWDWSFGAAHIPMLKSHQGGYHASNITSDMGGLQILLNYRQPDMARDKNAFETVTLGQVLRGEVPPAKIADRIVLIGSTATSITKDYVLAPLRTNQGQVWNIPGVEHQAHMTSQLIAAGLGERKLLRPLAMGQDGFILVAMALTGAAVAIIIAKPMVTLLISGGLVLVFYGLCWVGLVAWGLWLPLVPGAIALISSSALTTVILTQISEKKNHLYNPD